MNYRGLNDDFASGESVGRSIFKDWTDANDNLGYLPWSDDCGHGTHMAGAIGAPKNGANIVGVAWKADLVSIRHHDDPVDFFDNENTAEAIDMAAGEYQSDIINMSFGLPGGSMTVSMMIAVWYNQSEVLFIAAAGTSKCWDGTWGVTFPADKEPEVQAVTAAGSDGQLFCESHYGPEVDFVSYARQPTTGALFLQDQDIAKADHTSNAAAVASGVAALVWSQNPSWTRDQVIARMCTTASAGGHNHPTHGCGTLNAFAALGGFYRVDLTSYGFVEPSGPTAYDYTVLSHYGGDGPFAYEWTASEEDVELINATSRTVTAVVDETVDFFRLYVTVTDTSDGAIVQESEFTEVVNCDPEVDPEWWA